MKPSPLLTRAVELLQEREVIYRDSLIQELWPLVQPGVAHRVREREVQRLRKRGMTHIGRRDITVAQRIEYGAKIRVRESICQWASLGILSEVELDERRAYRLQRIPKALQ